jgi:predicted CoA-binding protein
MHSTLSSGKRTLVLGASDHPHRYAFQAVLRLKQMGHFPIPVGIRPGTIDSIPILLGQPTLNAIDTVTIYLHPRNQKMHQDYIIGLHPNRIIFNPGAENPVFEQRLRTFGIEVLEACTLVMLSIGNF